MYTIIKKEKNINAFCYNLFHFDSFNIYTYIYMWDILKSHFLYILTASIFSSFPIIFVNNYIKSNNIIWILLVISSYTILGGSYYYLLKYVSNNLTKLYSTIKILSVILVVLLNNIFLHEKITIKNIIGIILGTISITLL